MTTPPLSVYRPTDCVATNLALVDRMGREHLGVVNNKWRYALVRQLVADPDPAVTARLLDLASTYPHLVNGLWQSALKEHRLDTALALWNPPTTRPTRGMVQHSLQILVPCYPLADIQTVVGLIQATWGPKMLAKSGFLSLASQLPTEDVAVWAITALGMPPNPAALAQALRRGHQTLVDAWAPTVAPQTVTYLVEKRRQKLQDTWPLVEQLYAYIGEADRERLLQIDGGQHADRLRAVAFVADQRGLPEGRLASPRRRL